MQPRQRSLGLSVDGGGFADWATRSRKSRQAVAVLNGNVTSSNVLDLSMLPAAGRPNPFDNVSAVPASTRHLAVEITRVFRAVRRSSCFCDLLIPASALVLIALLQACSPAVTAPPVTPTVGWSIRDATTGAQIAMLRHNLAAIGKKIKSNFW